MSTFQTGLTGDLSLSRLGKPGGFAPLGLDSKVPVINLPTGLAGGLTLQGGYDANTNTPDLTAPAQQSDGALYIVTVEGTQDLGIGPKFMSVGDAIFYSTSDAQWYCLQGSVLGIEVVYDNTGTSIVGVNVQDAITELDTRTNDIKYYTNSINLPRLIPSISDPVSSIDSIILGGSSSIGEASNLGIILGVGSSLSGGSVSNGSSLTASNLIGWNNQLSTTGDGADSNFTNIIGGDNTVINSNISNIIGGDWSVSGNSSVIGIGWDGAIEQTNCTRAIAIGEAVRILANSPDAICMGWGSSVNTAQRGMALGVDTDALARDAIALGYQAQASAELAIQLGAGTNSTASTLQFLTNTLANAQGLYTSHTAVNYTPADVDNVTSHFAGIDSAIGAIGAIATPYLVYNNDTAPGSLPVADRECIAIGKNSSATLFSGASLGTIAIGYNAQINGNKAVLIGADSQGIASSLVCIGPDTYGGAAHTVTIGNSATAGQSNLNTAAIAIGHNSNARSTRATAIGSSAATGLTAEEAVALGHLAIANASRSIQLGEGTNATADTIQYKTVSIANNRVVTPYQLSTEVTTTTTAVNGEILPVDVSSGAVTVNPPASPQALDTFAVSDSRSNAATNNITVDFITATQNFHGASANHLISTDKGYAEFMYVNSTVGWILK